MKRFGFILLLAVTLVPLFASVVLAQAGTISDAFTAVQAGVATALGYALAAVVAILGGVLILMAGRALLRRFAKV